MIPRVAITGVILAGGRARRMGGDDKGLVALAGRPMIEHVLSRLEHQVHSLIINANRNLDRYAQYGHRVVSDPSDDFSGPLAGMASAMGTANTPYILTAPCDCPVLPKDLAHRLASTLSDANADIAVAHDGERMQPVFALMSVALRPSLEQALAEDERKIDRWYARHTVALADFSDQAQAFRNVNTPQERDALAAFIEPLQHRIAP